MIVGEGKYRYRVVGKEGVKSQFVFCQKRGCDGNRSDSSRDMRSRS